jgi:hypothetical protein
LVCADVLGAAQLSKFAYALGTASTALAIAKAITVKRLFEVELLIVASFIRGTTRS